MRGYCLIPADNLKQYIKVTKRLKKDKIQYTEELIDDSDWTAMDCESDYQKILFVQKKSDCIKITYESK